MIPTPLVYNNNLHKMPRSDNSFAEMLLFFMPSSGTQPVFRRFPGSAPPTTAHKKRRPWGAVAMQPEAAGGESA
ncbi:hypothetical protein GCM10027172_05170 [Halomonas garicola]